MVPIVRLPQSTNTHLLNADANYVILIFVVIMFLKANNLTMWRNKKIVLLAMLFLVLALLLCVRCYFASEEANRRSTIARLINTGARIVFEYSQSYDGNLPSTLRDFAEWDSSDAPRERTYTQFRNYREVSFDDISEGRIDYVYLGGGLSIKGRLYDANKDHFVCEMNGQIRSPEWHAANPEAHRTIIMHSKPGVLGNWIVFLFLDGRVECVKSKDAKTTAHENNWIYPGEGIGVRSIIL